MRHLDGGKHRNIDLLQAEAKQNLLLLKTIKYFYYKAKTPKQNQTTPSPRNLCQGATGRHVDRNVI